MERFSFMDGTIQFASERSNDTCSDGDDVPTNAIANAFRKALEAAGERAGATAPNPPVGCALLSQTGAVLAVAAHQVAGGPHAEALAIAEACRRGLVERIHTVVVTLEPCNHTGRTPPCTAALLRTPAKVVWIGSLDPNETVSGGGSEALFRAGLAVKTIGQLQHPNALELATSSARLIAPFAKLCRTGRPFVVIKQAIDRDGSTIPPPGHKTFTSNVSLTAAHQLRRQSDAILTGSGTILADQPTFTVRHVPDFTGKQRHLIIMDRRRRVGADYIDAARGRGFVVKLFDDLEPAIDFLGQAGCLQVLIEAGTMVTEAVRQAGIWDEQRIFRQNALGQSDSVTILSKASQ